MDGNSDYPKGIARQQGSQQIQQERPAAAGGAPAQVQQYPESLPQQASPRSVFHILDRRMIIPLVIIIFLIVAAGVVFFNRGFLSGGGSKELVESAPSASGVSSGSAGSGQGIVEDSFDRRDAADVEKAAGSVEYLLDGWYLQGSGYLSLDSFTGLRRDSEAKNGFQAGFISQFSRDMHDEYAKKVLSVSACRYGSGEGALSQMHEIYRIYSSGGGGDQAFEPVAIEDSPGESSTAFMLVFSKFPEVDGEMFRSVSILFVEGSYLFQVSVQGYTAGIEEVREIADLVESTL